jgi:CubicO group peptidase (beta-lactamase class C family)
MEMCLPKNLFALGAAAGILTVPPPEAWGQDAPAGSPPLSATAQTLETIRKKYDLPALAVVVVKNGIICDRAAVGIRKTGDPTPVTTNDVFHIGSCTKSMTATLAAMFIEEGKLSWDTTVAEIFPELKGRMDSRYADVTVRQLLTQLGGVPGEPPAAAWASAWQEKGTPVEQRHQFITAVLTQPPAASPGTQFIYSNQGYAIVGAMLERIANRPWEDLITEKLFQPLHMDSAGFGPPGTVGKTDQPWGHKRELLKTIPVQSDNPPAIAPAGRVHCSLDDLARYAICHMEGERTGGLLKPETFRQLHTPPAGGDYACGWVCRSDHGRVIWHNGSNTMWYVLMWLCPEKDFAAIVGTNIAGPPATKACDETVKAMAFWPE